MKPLFESEAKLMEILWARGPLPAKEIAEIAAQTVGWNKNTTYTVLKKLTEKGFLRETSVGGCREAVQQLLLRQTCFFSNIFKGSVADTMKLAHPVAP